MTSGFDHSSILPPDPDLEVLHDREYRVRAFRKDPNLLIRGAVRDQKPAGLYFADDPQPLTIHHMQVDLEVSFPALEIIDATVHFEMHPNDSCPSITNHYRELIGLSIARGFTHKVRELFGGPRGCSHTTALLQAMAPVAVQCSWSMMASNYQRSLVGRGPDEPAASSSARAAAWRLNLNTCHVWDEHGAFVENIQQGGPTPLMLFASKRLAELNREVSDPRNVIGRG